MANNGFSCLEMFSLVLNYGQPNIVKLWDAYVLYVEISTGVCSYWNSKSTRQWILEPVMIEECFNFLNALPWVNESVCSTRIYLH